MKKNKQGFTLIELLVVIAIIGILSTLSVIALNTARARARDAKRISDIRQIQTALAMYHSIEENDYPANLLALTTHNPPLMLTVPSAPTPADGSCDTSENAYVYTRNATDPVSYTITYCLGADTGGITLGPNTATPAGIWTP